MAPILQRLFSVILIIYCLFQYQPSQSKIIVKPKSVLRSSLSIKEQQIGEFDWKSFTETTLYYDEYQCTCNNLTHASRREPSPYENEIFSWILLTKFSTVCSAEEQVVNIRGAAYDHVIFFDPNLDENSLPLNRQKLKLISPRLLEAMKNALSISFITLKDAKELMKLAKNKDYRFRMEISKNSDRPKEEESQESISRNRDRSDPLRGLYYDYTFHMSPYSYVGYICMGALLAIITFFVILISRMTNAGNELAGRGLEGHYEYLQRVFKSYEEKRRLEMTAQALAQIPIILANQRELDECAVDASPSCMICMDDFAAGDSVPAFSHGCLKNNNFIHSQCLEDWLKKAAKSTGKIVCPICRKGIKP